MGSPRKVLGVGVGNGARFSEPSAERSWELGVGSSLNTIAANSAGVVQSGPRDKGQDLRHQKGRQGRSGQTHPSRWKEQNKRQQRQEVVQELEAEERREQEQRSQENCDPDGPWVTEERGRMLAC